MQIRETRFGYTLRIDSGEEIVASLTAFAERSGVRAGMFSGIGAVGETELGFLDRATRDYTRRVFRGEYEIVSLTGNFTELDGRPFPHCHLAIAAEDFAVSAGHLFRAVVTATCEVQVVTDPRPQRRVRRADLGFNLMELDEPRTDGR